MPSVAPSIDTKPVVPASVLTLCGEAAIIPPNANRPKEWEIMGQDRRTLAECAALNIAKTEVIKTLTQ